MEQVFHSASFLPAVTPPDVELQVGVEIPATLPLWSLLGCNRALSHWSPRPVPHCGHPTSFPCHASQGQLVLWHLSHESMSPVRPQVLWGQESWLLLRSEMTPDPVLSLDLLVLTFQA